MNKNSILFDTYIKKKHIDDKIKRLDIAEYLVPVSELTEVLDRYKRKYKYLLTNKIVEAVQVGEIGLVVLPEDVKVPTFLNTWMDKDPSNRVRSIVNIGGYRDLTFSDGMFTGNDSILFSLIQTGYIVKNSSLHANVVTNNINIALGSMEIYSSLVNKILDKLHSVSLNITEKSAIEVEINKYFLSRILGREENEKLLKLAKSTIPDSNSKHVSSKVTGYSEMDFKEFIEYLSGEFSTLKKLTFRNFISAWMTMYNSITVLGLELFPYFLGNIVGNVMVGSSLIKSFFIERSTGVLTFNKVYSELAKKI